MGEIVDKSVELKQSQWIYLGKMVADHHLPDASKALRCLINHAIEKAELEGQIFDEVRCMDC